MNGRRIGWTEEVTLTLLRVVAGFLFWQHGVQKLFGVLGRPEPVEFFTLYGLAGVLETVGGALLVLGLFTRPVAFILSGQMAWAYFQVHAPEAFWPIMNTGNTAALYSFLFLYLAARGGGGFSVDGLLRSLKGRKDRKTAAAPERPAPASERPARAPEEIPELTEDDLAEDPEIAELLRDDPRG
jgi:putative oxidoreductase